MANRIHLISLLLLGLFCSCSSSSWNVSEIAAGDPLFDSSRLRFISPQAHPPLIFEMIKIKEKIEAFVYLSRFRFTSEEKIKMTFRMGDSSFEEWVPVYEGAMRVRLFPETVEKVIQALQDGQEVAILIDGFEEILEPEEFSNSFAKFVGKRSFFEKLLKGPLE